MFHLWTDIRERRRGTERKGGRGGKMTKRQENSTALKKMRKKQWVRGGRNSVRERETVTARKHVFHVIWKHCWWWEKASKRESEKQRDDASCLMNLLRSVLPIQTLPSAHFTFHSLYWRRVHTPTLCYTKYLLNSYNPVYRITEVLSFLSNWLC